VVRKKELESSHEWGWDAMDQNPNVKSRSPKVSWRDEKMTPLPRAKVRVLTYEKWVYQQHCFSNWRW